MEQTKNYIGEFLTIKNAKELVGRKIRVKYDTYNEGEQYFKLVGYSVEKQKQIGQETNLRLHTLPLDSSGVEMPFYSRPKYFFNGKEIFNTHNCFIVDGIFFDCSTLNPKKYLSCAAVADEIKRLEIKNKDGLTLTDFKVGPDGVNDGWLALYSFTLSDGTVVNGDDAIFSDRHSKCFQCFKKLKSMFNILDCREAKTGDAKWFEVDMMEYETWCYEWQGVFRYGSGAEPLIIASVE